MLRKKYPEETEKQIKSFFDSLNERVRRRYAAIEAIKLGHRGVLSLNYFALIMLVVSPYLL
jgi:hypothetical protein